jgi:hypothetical protein
LSDPELANFYRTSNEGHLFFHFGYSFRAMWMEVSPLYHAHELQQVGMHIDRQIPLAGGSIATLLRLTREDALANPYSRYSVYFFPPLLPPSVSGRVSGPAGYRRRSRAYHSLPPNGLSW